MNKFPKRDKKIVNWVNKMAELCQPEKIVWIDGSQAQKEALEKEAIADGEIISLNHNELPGCFLHRSAPDDVARTEHLTFNLQPEKARCRPHQ